MRIRKVKMGKNLEKIRAKSRLQTEEEACKEIGVDQKRGGMVVTCGRSPRQPLPGNNKEPSLCQIKREKKKQKQQMLESHCS